MLLHNALLFLPFPLRFNNTDIFLYDLGGKFL